MYEALIIYMTIGLALSMVVVIGINASEEEFHITRRTLVILFIAWPYFIARWLREL